MTHQCEPILCPICGINDATTFARCDGRTIVRCRHCDLVYVNPRPTEEDLRSFFTREYIPTEQAAHQLSIVRAATLEREAGLLKTRKARGRLLDIGCASGYFLRQFTDGWELYGIEPSGHACHAARQSLNAHVFHGTLLDAKYPNAFFDLVTILDTFPLLPNPVQELHEIARVLKPDGILGIEVPGYCFRMIKNKGPLCKLLYGQWVKLNPRVHHFYYSNTTLVKVLKKSGFEVIDMAVEQAPVTGARLYRTLNALHFRISQLLYTLTWGKVILASKVLYICSKKA